MKFIFLFTLLLETPLLAKEKVWLSYDNKTIPLDVAQEYTNEDVYDGKEKIYLSSYSDIVDTGLFIAKKIESFLNLFQDDTEPYTYEHFKRSQCLISTKNNTVDFYSGGEIFWSNCSRAHKQYKKSMRSVRFWTVCKNNVFEFTVIDYQPNKGKIKFSCEGRMRTF